MNERIQELALQAAGQTFNHTRNGEFEKKFAELIIRECVLAVNTVYENAEPDHGCYDWATFADGKDILNHFGLEE